MREVLGWNATFKGYFFFFFFLLGSRTVRDFLYENCMMPKLYGQVSNFDDFFDIWKEFAFFSANTFFSCILWRTKNLVK